MYRQTPIICPNCHQDSGYTHEQFQFYVIMDDIHCQRCGFTIICSKKIICDDVHLPTWSPDEQLRHWDIIPGDPTGWSGPFAPHSYNISY